MALRQVKAAARRRDKEAKRAAKARRAAPVWRPGHEHRVGEATEAAGHAEYMRSLEPAVASRCARLHATYPPPAKVPRCPEDPRFALALDVPRTPTERAAARTFLARHGYVVFRGAVGPDGCAAARDEIYAQLEASHEGFRRGEPSTYGALCSKRYGLPREQVVSTPAIARNRQAPGVRACFAALLLSEDEIADDENAEAAVATLETSEEHGSGGAQPAACAARALARARPRAHERMYISQDRWCFYRPTAGAPDEWATRPNVHLDVDPWSFIDGSAVPDMDYSTPSEFRAEVTCVSRDAGGPKVQAVVSLADNLEEDGGTVVVPGFNRTFEEWARALGPPEEHAEVSSAAGWAVRRKGGGGSFKFDARDPLYGLARRVPVREGDLLVWDQRCVHGSGPNASSSPRLAQFLRCVRRECVPPPARAARARAVLASLVESGFDLDRDLTSIGYELFGFADLEEDGFAHGR